MSEMIERVTRVLHEQQTEQGVHVAPAFDDCKEWHKEILRRWARAAIEAVRLPTPEMLIGAFNDPARMVEALGAWERMIDAALSPPSQGANG